MEQVSAKRSYFSSARIAVIAMFSALAAILYIFNFALPFAFPSFLEFKFSDIPVLIGSFALGPVSSVIIVVSEILIKLVVKGSFAVTAGIIYKKHRTFKGALVGMAVGTAVEVVVAVLINWLFLVPFYVQFLFNGNWAPLINAMNKLFPNCTRENFYNYYLWVSVLPFNLLRCLVAVLVTLPVYKRISMLINRFNARLEPKSEEGAVKSKKINIAAICISAVVIVLLLTFAILRVLVFSE